MNKKIYTHTQLLDLAMPRTAMLVVLSTYIISVAQGYREAFVMRDTFREMLISLSPQQAKVYDLLVETVNSLWQAGSYEPMFKLLSTLMLKGIAYLPGRMARVMPYDLMVGKEDLAAIVNEVFGEGRDG